jgi:ribosomal-protein-alanine N-acetyltransferase
MNHTGTNNIETERLLLRKYTVDDASDIFNNNIMNYESIDETKKSLVILIDFYNELDTYEWAIELKENKKIIGLIRVMNNDENKETCDINYFISKNYRNKGYATEAAYYVLRYLIRDVGYNRIEGAHSIDNVASGRVMEKAGMKYEKTSKDKFYDIYDDKYIECKEYGIMKKDLI